jgi:hypothetical protein
MESAAYYKRIFLWIFSFRRGIMPLAQAVEKARERNRTCITN